MTRASAGRRRRRLETRGRPTGSYTSLFKDPQRFSIAGWLALDPIVGPLAAAETAITWIEERTPITFRNVEGLLVMISADYTPPATKELKDHADDLVKKARLVTSRATESELAWLTQSSGALKALITFLIRGNIMGFEQVAKVLRQAGWGEILDRFGARIAPSLRAQFPLYEGPLTAAARELLAALRAKTAPKT
jgi:hypothetical protein